MPPSPNTVNNGKPNTTRLFPIPAVCRILAAVSAIRPPSFEKSSMKKRILAKLPMKRDTARKPSIGISKASTGSGLPMSTVPIWTSFAKPRAYPLNWFNNMYNLSNVLRKTLDTPSGLKFRAPLVATVSIPKAPALGLLISLLQSSNSAKNIWATDPKAPASDYAPMSL